MAKAKVVVPDREMEYHSMSGLLCRLCDHLGLNREGSIPQREINALRRYLDEHRAPREKDGVKYEQFI